VTGNVTGNVNGDVVGDLDGQITLSNTTLQGDGSTSLTVSPTNGINFLESSATGDAATLADGSSAGQTTTILMTVDGGGDVVVTPTTFLNGTNMTFADAGDAVTLVWTGATGWAVVNNEGVVVA
jgi:hypothetical protein